jgi:hypothetical protein
MRPSQIGPLGGVPLVRERAQLAGARAIGGAR